MWQYLDVRNTILETISQVESNADPSQSVPNFIKYALEQYIATYLQALEEPGRSDSPKVERITPFPYGQIDGGIATQLTNTLLQEIAALRAIRIIFQSSLTLSHSINSYLASLLGPWLEYEQAAVAYRKLSTQESEASRREIASIKFGKRATLEADSTFVPQITEPVAHQTKTYMRYLQASTKRSKAERELNFILRAEPSLEALNQDRIIIREHLAAVLVERKQRTSN